ncbi:unnamed protein product [Absidia cylindrospora]
MGSTIVLDDYDLSLWRKPLSINRMTAKSIPWFYYINDTTVEATVQQLDHRKQRKKQSRRSKSMFEWPLPMYNSTTNCFTPTTMSINPTSSSRPHVEQHNQYSTLESPHVYVHQEDTNLCNTNDTLNDFPSSNDDEKNGLSPISTTDSPTSSTFQRQSGHPHHPPLKPLRHYNDSDDDDDYRQYKLPIRSWSLKQQSTNNSTMQCTQRFLTQFVKAFVSSGAPSHRLDHCTRLLLRKWNMAAQFGYFPGFMMISFENPYDTFPTRVQLVKMESDLDIHRLIGIYQVFENIMLDEMTIREATCQLDRVTQASRLYSNWTTIFAYGVASSTSMPLFFYGGWMDMVFGLGLGMMVAVGSVYVSRRITRFASIFDVVQCSIVGFLAATASSRMASTTTCFYALSVGGVVNLLPGYAALVAMLEIASGDAAVASGTLRLTTTLVYSLLLGFGLAIGASTHQLLFPRLALISSHASCENTLSSWSHNQVWHHPGPGHCVAWCPLYLVTLLCELSSPGDRIGSVCSGSGIQYLCTASSNYRVCGYDHRLVFSHPGSVGVSSTLDTFGHALSNAASSPSPSNTSAVAEMSIILNAGQQGILFAVHMMVITVSVAMGLVLAALVVYPVRKLLECSCVGLSSFSSSPSSSSSSSILSASSALSPYCVSPSSSKRKIKYRKRDWIGEVTF